jgi:hypothetical protein
VTPRRVIGPDSRMVDLVKYLIINLRIFILQ